MTKKNTLSGKSAALPEETGARRSNISERIYTLVKQDIFEFRLLPGDRFTETEIAERMSASRTPVRHALYQLEREGFLEVYFRNGWRVRPFDFERFDELYAVRIVLELAAVEQLGLVTARLKNSPELVELKAVWLDGPRETDGPLVSTLDERFHSLLVGATGNREMTRIHRELSEKLRIIRRLDFTKGPRIDATYSEHGAILRAIFGGKTERAKELLLKHIETSRAEVRKITLHMLQEAHRSARPA
jgi:DNA-binding GntR family transcriptional regulator